MAGDQPGEEGLPLLDWPTTKQEEDSAGPKAPHRPPHVALSLRSWPVRVVGALALLAILGSPFVAVRRAGGRSLGSDQRLFLRVGGVTNEGIGSAIQRFKESIILSQALNSTLLITEQPSEHGYLTSRLINSNLDWFSRSVDTRRSCLLSDYLPYERRQDLSRAWCGGTPAAMEEIARVGERMKHCNSIIDVGPQEVTEDFNGCIQDWLRARLNGTTVATRHASKKTVGVHVRWGDSAGQMRATMSFANINRILRDLRAEFGEDGLHIKIAMEQANSTVLEEQLELGSYELIDSPNPMNDLHSLGDSDYLLVGVSSFGALAHLLAPEGLTIYQNQGWSE